MSASYSVAAGSAAALICDTGALFDYLVASAPDHRRLRNAIDQASMLGEKIRDPGPLRLEPPRART